MIKFKLVLLALTLNHAGFGALNDSDMEAIGDAALCAGEGAAVAADAAIKAKQKSDAVKAEQDQAKAQQEQAKAQQAQAKAQQDQAAALNKMAISKENSEQTKIAPNTPVEDFQKQVFLFSKPAAKRSFVQKHLSLQKDFSEEDLAAGIERKFSVTDEAAQSLASGLYVEIQD